MRPNTYNPDCDFDPDQRDLDASIEERNKTEPDATVRAYENSALYEFELYLHENGQALRIPDAIPGSVMVAAEKFAEQYATKHLERQTPAIERNVIAKVREAITKTRNHNWYQDINQHLDAIEKEINEHQD